MSVTTPTLTPDQINRLAHPKQIGRFRKLTHLVANAPALVNVEDGTVELYVGPELTRFRKAEADEVQAMLTAAGETPTVEMTPCP